MTDNKKYTYSETFHSFQGEGVYTGISTAWIRFFTCNLQCDGMGQKDPTDPSTYILPYKDFDVSSVTRVEDLPVFEYGCDSSYTWAKKFKHLMSTKSASEICDEITSRMVHKSNPSGLFWHPKTRQWAHMAFTGGEPMLNQDAILNILLEFTNRNNRPAFVTVETNGTKPIKNEALKDLIMWTYRDYEPGREWFWSCSPKLFSTSGEKNSKAICPDVVAGYTEVSDSGQLKYVVNGTQQSWDEVEEHTAAFREAGVDWPVWIMGVGATKEEQEDGTVAKIAMEAIKRGYSFSGRLHCHVLGNAIGT